MSLEEQMNIFFTITFLNIWWVAIWGICYIAIDLIAGKNKVIELTIYVCIMIFVILVLSAKPQFIKHLSLI